MTTENTELERRVLAHERILKALIRHMSEAQPVFLDRLKSNFGSSHTLGQHEQDFTSTRQYGEQFIEAIEKSIRTGHDPS